jgi:hypothetical protein
LAIERSRLNELARLSHAGKLFGVYFTHVETLVYRVAGALSREYDGGYWDFYALSHGGFYQAPNADRPFYVVCDNMFEGALSADALGITACLYAYSHLSFSRNRELGQMFAQHYHLLREYMLEHPEAGDILQAID